MLKSSITGVIAVSIFVLSACDNSSTGPSAVSAGAVDASVALVAADATLGDLDAIASSDGGGLPFDGSRTIAYLDAAGNAPDDYDEQTTATIIVVSQVSGGASRETWTAEISRTSEITITGLEGDETTRTVNGSGSSVATRSRHDDELGTRTFDMSGTSLIEGLVVGVPREEDPYPLAGTISRNMIVTRTAEDGETETTSRSVIITFNGSQFAEMTVDGEAFEVDLATPQKGMPVRGGGFRGR